MTSPSAIDMDAELALLKESINQIESTPEPSTETTNNEPEIINKESQEKVDEGDERVEQIRNAEAQKLEMRKDDLLERARIIKESRSKKKAKSLAELMLEVESDEDDA
jgi:hypothetical protein